MSEAPPRIRSRRLIEVSPWMDVIVREVEHAGGGTEDYYAVAQLDYIAILALTPDGSIPLVRQFRPAVEAFTWELPAGLVERGEDPSVTCRRELLEETGYAARAVHALGTTAPCTGRLSNRLHNFFVETGARDPSFVPEPGVACELVSPVMLARMIAAGEFSSQLHLGTLMLAERRSFLKLP